MEWRVSLSPKLGVVALERGGNAGQIKKAETSLLQVVHLQGVGNPRVGDFNAISYHKLLQSGIQIYHVNLLESLRTLRQRGS